MSNDYKETNFEAIDRVGAKKLIDNLPEFEATTDIEETDYQLGDIMFSDDGTPVVTTEVKKPKLPAVIGDNLDQDFDESRRNLRELSERQSDILDHLFKLCKASDSPRAYEVLGQMIDRFTVLEEKMIELYVKKAKAIKESGDESGNTQVAKTINNNQYNVQMTTKELLEELSREDEEKENDE